MYKRSIQLKVEKTTVEGLSAALVFKENGLAHLACGVWLQIGWRLILDDGTVLFGYLEENVHIQNFMSSDCTKLDKQIMDKNLYYVDIFLVTVFLYILFT